MALPLYLAQTPLEMAGNPMSERVCWMACHFSAGGRGLSGLPPALPPGAILILDDSTPMDDHDPALILRQLGELLEKHRCEGLLLDFQRKELPQQQKLAALLAESLPCPVGVSAGYARELSCSVFLPTVPPDMLLSRYLSPWRDREVWLDAALDGITLTLTPSGCRAGSAWDFPEEGPEDEKLHCHYSVEITSDAAVFHLWRTRPDLDALLTEAQELGVHRAIGLWQELGE